MPVLGTANYILFLRIFTDSWTQRMKNDSFNSLDYHPKTSRFLYLSIFRLSESGSKDLANIISSEILI